MKFVFKVISLIILTLSYASSNEYVYTQTIELGKDQEKKLLVHYGDRKKLFKFRWTLYVNGGLVLLRSYDRFVAQNMLFLKPNRTTVRVDLKSSVSAYGNVPYMLIKFVEYDFEKKKVIFKLFLSDRKSEIRLEHLKDT